MTDLIIRDWNDKSIRQREDGFMSATDMCTAGGKLFGHWHTLKTTREYLDALEAKHYRDRDNGPIEVNQGGIPENQGTWVDRRVALRLAQWISPEFALQVDEWVEELMTRGTVSIASVPEPTPIALPPADVRIANLSAALDSFGIDKTNPRFAQGLQDLALNILGVTQTALPGTSDKWCGVAERAQFLGYSVGTVVKHRGTLGKWVKPRIPAEDGRSEDRLCNGVMKGVQIYRITDRLDDAIVAFFTAKGF